MAERVGLFGVWYLLILHVHKFLHPVEERKMQEVEFIGLELGTPGYFYPVWIWDLGLDNVRISKRGTP